MPDTDAYWHPVRFAESDIIRFFFPVDPDSERIGDAIGNAVLQWICDTLPHGHSDDCPFCDAFTHNRFDTLTHAEFA